MGAPRHHTTQAADGETSATGIEIAKTTGMTAERNVTYRAISGVTAGETRCPIRAG